MTEEIKNLTCKICGAENTVDASFCSKCGSPLAPKIDDIFTISFESEIIKPFAEKGDVIADRYEIIEQIGKGGMGIVYKATDKKLERVIALKTLKLLPFTGIDEEEIHMMLTEAQLAAKLNHTNIVTVFDVGIENVPPYIAMEFIDGITLSEIIKIKKISNLGEAVNYVIQICDAIAHAHSKGILHRDLKPQNIMIAEGKVKITDFGIAKIVKDTESTISAKESILGTPPYMSPERFQGAKADFRSDIFAIGVILYEIMTGKLPFKGDTYTDIMIKILYHEHVPMRELKAAIPEYMESIVAKAMEKDPAKRYQDVLSFKNALEEFQHVTINTHVNLVTDQFQRRPQIWNVPFLHNTNFTGREEILDKIYDELNHGKTGSTTIVIHGLGGVGKTQLAVEYAYRNTGEYSLVWWIFAEEHTTLSSDFAALASQLGINTQNLKEDQIINIVKGWLEHNSGWLLIFDNAEDPKALRNFITRNQNGHALITSRNPNWKGIALTIPVGKMQSIESIELLHKWTNESDEQAITELADVLGDLPLALEQAGAYIETTGISTTDYLELLKEHQRELLEKEIVGEDQSKTVATTWEISFQKVYEISPIGADLMNLCSFLGPDNIPRKTLITGAVHLPEPLKSALSNPLKFNDAIVALRNFSLVDSSTDGLTFHRLVQAVVRDRLSLDERKRYADIAMRLMFGTFPFDIDVTKTWIESARLLPHVLAAVDHAELLGVARDIIGGLLSKTGMYLKNSGQSTEAKILLEKALEFEENFYGHDHPMISNSVDNVGCILRELGDYASAKIYFERALTIDEKALGEDHPNVTLRLNNLGLILLELGNIEKSRKSLERAIAIDQKLVVVPKRNIERDHNNLGMILRIAGELDAAKKHFETAIEIGEKEFGLDHHNIATHLNNLGIVLNDQGKPDQALVHFKRGLVIEEKAFGSEHPQLTYLLNNLGFTLKELGQYKDAQIYLERAITIDEQVYGPDHPNISYHLNNLGLVLRDMGEPEEALKSFNRAITIGQKTWGDSHPNIANLLNNIGLCLKDIGDFSSALENIQKSLDLFQKAFGIEHHAVSDCYAGLGEIMREKGEYQKSQKYFEQALYISNKIFGPVHPNAAKILDGIGRINWSLGKLDTAKENFEKALEIDIKAYGDNHPNVASRLQNIGEVLQKQGLSAIAKDYYSRACEIFNRSYGIQHPKTLAVQHLLDSLK
jgi:serine/threonine protein kinase/tetratricopeptide (TPR) repeat protein